MPRMRFPLRGRKSGVAILLIVLLALLRIYQDGLKETTPEALAEGPHQVERVVDGDTLKLANGARVRLIGVDTPETVKPNWPVEPFGPEASDYTKAFVDDAGGQVELRFDRERKDKYDRFLAYVYSGDRFLNEELILEGLATAEPQYNYAQSMKTRFLDAEAAAKTAGRGVWSLETSPRNE